MDALYIDDLERGGARPNDGGSHDGASHPRHDGLRSHGDARWIHARCHPSSPTWAFVAGRVVAFQCAACAAPVLRLWLATRPEAPDIQA